MVLKPIIHLFAHERGGAKYRAFLSEAMHKPEYKNNINTVVAHAVDIM